MATHKSVRSRLSSLFFAFLLAFCTTGISACDSEPGFALSLKPFYADADLESDPALTGSWTDAEDGVTFTFDQPEGKQYKLVVKETDNDRTSSAEFEAHLFRLGG